MAEPDRRQHESSAEEMIFDANLKEFAVRIGLIVGLESNAKIGPAEAYDRIKDLWKQLKKSKKNLGVGSEPKTDEPETDEPEQGDEAQG